MKTELTKDDYVLDTDPTTVSDQKTVVTVLVIEHRSGIDTSVFRSDTDASIYLAGWVHDWWSELVERSGAPDEPPADDTEAINMYFELHGDETYHRDIVIVR